MTITDRVPSPQLAFLDIEASGLGPTSYPIEVGWAPITAEVKSILIRPAMSWQDDEWDDMAAAVHGIDRLQLELSGMSPWDVAIRLNAELGHPEMTVLSDAPGQDSFWLDRLFAEAPVIRDFRLNDFTRAMVQFGMGDRAEFADDLRRHRAAADAAMLRDLWLRGTN